MADDQDKSQKTEDPTQKKLDEAQSKGEVAKSQEVKHWFILFAITLVLLISARSSTSGISDALSQIFKTSHAIPVEGDHIIAYMGNLLAQIATYLIVPVIILVAAALAGAMVQNPPLFTFEKIKPKPDKISPLAGFKKLFSIQNTVEFLKSMLKIIIVAGVVFILVWPEKERLEQIMTYDVLDVMNLILSMALRVLGGVVAVMAVIAGMDFMFQKFQFQKQMRMSKQEVKDEMKQTDGDPHVKARLRQIRQERSRQRMMAAVPEADVVVTNPTHYAVAMKYEHGDMDVPKVIAKGVDNVALRIREVAEEHDIPILENPPLARALHSVVEIDEEIHPEHYQAVAEVIGYVMKLRKGQRAQYKPKNN